MGEKPHAEVRSQEQMFYCHMLPYSTILYHTPPYSTILHHTLPYSTILHHTLPYRTILYHTVPYSTILYHTLPYSTILCHTVPYSTILYHTPPYSTILYYGNLKPKHLARSSHSYGNKIWPRLQATAKAFDRLFKAVILSPSRLGTIRWLQMTPQTLSTMAQRR